MAQARGLRYIDPNRRRGRLYHAICRFSITRPGSWLSEKVAWRIDPLLLRLTRGRFSAGWPITPGLLETRGARTGAPRRCATLYFHDGDRVTLIASKQGRPENPSWYHNLLAHPDVTYGGRPFRAVVVTDEDERRRLWGLADRVFPPFADYRHWTAEAGREIPIVQLVRRGDSGSRLG
jgi:deazaflavin-dependent oxidoreductase (nitroreductase family)